MPTYCSQTHLALSRYGGAQEVDDCCGVFGEGLQLVQDGTADDDEPQVSHLFVCCVPTYEYEEDTIQILVTCTQTKIYGRTTLKEEIEGLATNEQNVTRTAQLGKKKGSRKNVQGVASRSMTWDTRILK